MRIDANRLPLNDIDHPAIRPAAEAWHQAQDELREAQRAVGKLDNGCQRAREADAEEAAAARRAGKAGTSRKHEQAFDRDLDAAQHEERVARALVALTRSAYQQALDEHADQWREQLDHEAEVADDLWNAALSTLLELHEQRTRAHARRRMLGATDLPAGAVRFRPEVLADSVTGQRLELARLTSGEARWRQRAVASVADVLAALQAADEPEVVEPMPAFAVADQIARAAEHARSVERGYTDEEIATGRLPGVIGDRPHVNGVPVHLPTGRGDP